MLRELKEAMCEKVFAELSRTQLVIQYLLGITGYCNKSESVNVCVFISNKRSSIQLLR